MFNKICALYVKKDIKIPLILSIVAMFLIPCAMSFLAVVAYTGCKYRQFVYIKDFVYSIEKAFSAAFIKMSKYTKLLSSN